MNFVQEIVNELYELFKVRHDFITDTFRKSCLICFYRLKTLIERPRIRQKHIREANVGNARSNPEPSPSVKGQQNATTTRSNALHHSRIDEAQTRQTAVVFVSANNSNNVTATASQHIPLFDDEFSSRTSRQRLSFQAEHQLTSASL